MDQPKDDQSRMGARTKIGDFAVLAPGLLLVAVACVVGVVWIAVAAERDSWFAYLVLLSIAGLAMSSFYSIRLSRLTWEQSQRMLDELRASIELQTRALNEALGRRSGQEEPDTMDVARHDREQ